MFTYIMLGLLSIGVMNPNPTFEKQVHDIDIAQAALNAIELEEEYFSMIKIADKNEQKTLGYVNAALRLCQAETKWQEAIALAKDNILEKDVKTAHNLFLTTYFKIISIRCPWQFK